MSTAAEALINAFLPVAERAVVALERWLDDARIGIVDDEPEGEHAPPNSTEPATVDNSGPDSDPQGLTVAELDALPEWSVVDATGSERWFVKWVDGDWSAVGETYFTHSEGLIADEGPIRLQCRAPGPDQLVIKRDERWHPGYLRLTAADLDACGLVPAAGVLRTVADALEQEGR